ncbi:hypothetical protein [Brochothrix thermosphacta]|uniref:hypothetical protein n=1 Tax=Brochothrix thermosphacta TaxID=2756 RepID=UPI003F9A05C7
MSKIIVEILYKSKNVINDTAKEILEKLNEESLPEKNELSKKKNKEIKYKFILLKESIYASYEYNSEGTITIKDVKIFQEFINKIKIESSRQKFKAIVLHDETALFFSKKALPYLHNYEWSLRKLIYLFVPQYYMSDWVKNTLSVDELKTIKSRKRNNIDEHNIMQQFTLYEIEDYLFGENYIKIYLGNEENSICIKDLDNQYLVNLIQSSEKKVTDVFSLWEEIFNDHFQLNIKSIKEDMKFIRNTRNIATHNQEFLVGDYEKLLKLLKKYIKKISSVCESVMAEDLSDDIIETMRNDIESNLINQGEIVSDAMKINEIGDNKVLRDAMKINGIDGSKLLRDAMKINGIGGSKLLRDAMKINGIGDNKVLRDAMKINGIGDNKVLRDAMKINGIVINKTLSDAVKINGTVLNKTLSDAVNRISGLGNNK